MQRADFAPFSSSSPHHLRVAAAALSAMGLAGCDPFCMASVMTENYLEAAPLAEPIVRKTKSGGRVTVTGMQAVQNGDRCEAAVALTDERKSVGRYGFDEIEAIAADVVAQRCNATSIVLYRQGGSNAGVDRTLLKRNETGSWAAFGTLRTCVL